MDHTYYLLSLGEQQHKFTYQVFINTTCVGYSVYWYSGRFHSLFAADDPEFENELHVIPGLNQLACIDFLGEYTLKKAIKSTLANTVLVRSRYPHSHIQ